MSKPDRQLSDQRAERNRARAEFTRRLGLARTDLAPAVLKRRAVAEAQRTTISVAQQAIEIANDSRGVVAATIGALLLWVARKPIIARAGPLLQRFQTRPAPTPLGDRFKLLIEDYWHRLKEYADD